MISDFIDAVMTCWSEILILVLLAVGFSVIRPLFKRKSKKYQMKLHSHHIESSDESICDDAEELEVRKMMMAQYGKILFRLIENKNIDQAEKLVEQISTPNTIIFTILMKAYA